MAVASPVDATQTRNPRIWALTAAAGGAAAVIATTISAIVDDALPVLEWLLVAAVALLGVWLAVYDFRERRLPNRLVWPLYAVTGVLVASCAIVSEDLGRLLIAVLAGVLLWAIYFVLGLLGAVAYGDVKLAGALGLALGWWGIIPALIGAAIAYFLALPHAVIYAAGKHGRQIPFGPYMIAGAIAVGIWNLLQS